MSALPLQGRRQAVRLATEESRQLLRSTASHAASAPPRTLRVAAAATAAARKYVSSIHLHSPHHLHDPL